MEKKKLKKAMQMGATGQHKMQMPKTKMKGMPVMKNVK